MAKKRDIQRILDNDLPAVVHAYHAHENGEEIGTPEAQARHEEAGRAILSDPVQARKWHPSRDPAKEIVRKLERLYHMTGHRPYRVFEDFVQICLATQMALPLVGLYARLNDGAVLPFEQEPEELQKIWNDIKARYERGHTNYWPTVYKTFAECWGLLREGPMFEDYNDVLGTVYQELGAANQSGMAQYFTPWGLAQMIAEINLGNGAILRDVTSRMLEAIERWGGAEPYTMMGMVLDLDHPETVKFVFEQNFNQTWPHYDPVIVYEPCIGSAVMMIAGMGLCERWMIDGRYIEWYGIDLDPVCVAMARLQMIGLYGANAYGMLCSLPFMLAEEDLPSQELLFLRVKQAFAYVQCGNALAEEFTRDEQGTLKLIHWTETERGKAWIAGEGDRKAEEKQRQHVAKQAQALKQQHDKAAARLQAVKDKAAATGQELLFDIALPPVEDRGALEADAKHANGHANGNGNRKRNGKAPAETTAGAAGDWNAFVERAQAVKGTAAAANGAKQAQAAVEELAEELTQGTLF